MPALSIVSKMTKISPESQTTTAEGARSEGAAYKINKKVQSAKETLRMFRSLQERKGYTGEIIGMAKKVGKSRKSHSSRVKTDGEDIDWNIADYLLEQKVLDAKQHLDELEHSLCCNVKNS